MSFLQCEFPCLPFVQVFIPVCKGVQEQFTLYGISVLLVGIVILYNMRIFKKKNIILLFSLSYSKLLNTNIQKWICALHLQKVQVPNKISVD